MATGIMAGLKNYYGIPEELILLLEDLYSKSMSAVRVYEELTEWFKITVGVRQRCGLSPDLFNLLLEAVTRLALNFVTLVLMYGSDCWYLQKEDERRILAAEMSWLRRTTKRDS